MTAPSRLTNEPTLLFVRKIFLPASTIARQWLFLTVVLLIVSGAIGWNLYAKYNTTNLQECGRLVTQAKVVDKNLNHQLTATNHALDSIRRDLTTIKAENDGMTSLKRRLETMRSAMPTTRAITVFDADGTLVARSPDQFVGENFSEREYFQVARQSSDSGKLYVVPPFLAKTGEYVLNVSKVILNERKEFDGVILVSLGPEYFDTLLKSVLYEPDMRTTLIHGDGKIIFRAPDPQGITGVDLTARPGAFFMQHMKSGKLTSVFKGVAAASNEARLTAFHTIRPALVPMDKPLVVAVSREMSALFAPWREDLLVHGGLFVMLALASTLGLFFYQKQQLNDARLSAVMETERKQAEQELRTNMEDLRDAQRIAHVGSWRLDIASNQVLWSEELYTMYGLDPKSPPPPYTEHQKLLTPESWEKLSAAVQNTKNTGIPHDLELETLRIDGSRGWMWVYGMSVVDASGVTVGLRGMAQDITERKQIEEVQSYLLQISSLKTSEDFFKSLARYLASILDMDYVCIDILHGDCLSVRTLAIYHDGKFEDNAEYALKGTPCGDVIGKEVCVFLREVQNLFPQDAVLQKLQAESYVGVTLWSFDMKPIGLIAVIGRKELSSSQFAETVLKLVSIRAAGELERRKAEEQKLQFEQQLQQTQKLESLGVLAGGIAHDFNNILMAIMGNADLALMRLNKESPAVENLHRIEQASARAADLARQMLAYSGKGKFVIENINLNILLEEMLHMLEVSISKKAVLRLNPHTPLPSVEADATQMRQIVMNLVINASEAIGDKNGVIAITTGCMECDRSYLNDVWLDGNISEGLYINLEIADTGCGMDKETLGKLFDPFFTTKFTGRGLGMAAVLGIVRGHKGAIKVYSEPNRGTTFNILLPASRRPAEVLDSASHHGDWKGEGKVLLVDDEETVRCIGTEMLKELGFSVITAADGREGVEQFKENPDISFVILDLTMPHMDGEQCFRELQQIKPDVKVIISSGYNEQEVTVKFVGKGLAGFIQKPYTLSIMEEAIQNICIR